MKLSPIIILVCAGCMSQQQKQLVKTTIVPPHQVPSYTKAEELKRIQACAALLEQNYMDSFSYDPSRDTTLRAMFNRLDPFTFYQTEDASKRYMSNVENEEDEILGITHVAIGDTTAVWHVLPGSAAHEIGLLPGDRILSLGKHSLLGLKRDSVRKLLKSELPCKAVVVRPTEWKQYKNVKLYAKPVKQGPTGEYFTLDDSTGYMALHHFTSGTYKGLYKGVKELLEEGGVSRLILDLRNNGGGYLDQALKITNLFIGDTSTMLELRTVHEKHAQLYGANGTGFGDLPLAIIVNGGSASASEVVAGTLQDLDRAIIIGSPSYGKGLCQKELPLSGVSGALHITTSKIITPSGRTVQIPYRGDSLVGIYIPDDRFADNVDHHLEREFLSADTTVYYTRNGRKVYGAMGVVPDVIAPWFSNKETREYAYNDTVEYNVYRYVTENYQYLFERYSTLDSFISMTAQSKEWIAVRIELKQRMFARLGTDGMKNVNFEDIAQYFLWSTGEMYFGEERTCVPLLENDRRVQAARWALDTKWKLLDPKPLPQPPPTPQAAKGKKLKSVKK